MYSPSIQELIRQFSHLPSVGKRTAERFVFHLLKSGKKDVAELTHALKVLMETVKSCEKCRTFAEQSPCERCSDQKRDQTTICVVAEPQDMDVIDKTGAYRGLYHVLRGTLRSDDPDTIHTLEIESLLKRVQTESIQEVILALSPTLPGETTMMYIEGHIKALKLPIRISRLARGLPTGSDLQYADDVTLTNAMNHRVSQAKTLDKDVHI
jgi:recombination protein RecR